MLAVLGNYVIYFAVTLIMLVAAVAVYVRFTPFN